MREAAVEVRSLVYEVVVCRGCGTQAVEEWTQGGYAPACGCLAAGCFPRPTANGGLATMKIEFRWPTSDREKETP